jgi:simple sugar transport system ATP-binding protein
MIIEKYRKEPFKKNGFLNRKEIDKFTHEMIKRFDIRPDSCAHTKVRELSVGNEQKVIIAREVENNPDLLIAVQPTRGLDVGAIEYVHKALINERNKGKAILLVSYELDEVMNVSDTIAVIYDGNIVGEFKQGEVDENKIGLLMAGGGAQNNAAGN